MVHAAGLAGLDGDDNSEAPSGARHSKTASMLFPSGRARRRRSSRMVGPRGGGAVVGPPAARAASWRVVRVSRSGVMEGEVGAARRLAVGAHEELVGSEVAAERRPRRRARARAPRARRAVEALARLQVGDTQVHVDDRAGRDGTRAPEEQYSRVNSPGHPVPPLAFERIAGKTRASGAHRYESPRMSSASRRYVELHATPPTASSTAPRCPRSSPSAPPSSAIDRARADRPRRRLRLARVRLRGARGRVRAITGAEGRSPTAPHVTLLVETPRGYANLCRLLTAAHARERLNPRLDPISWPSRNEGLVCLSAAPATGSAVSDPNEAARPREGVRARALLRRAPAPLYLRGDARRNAALARPGRTTSASAPSPPGTCTRTIRAGCACRTCSSPSEAQRRARGLRGRAARERGVRPPSPARGCRTLPRGPRGDPDDRRARRAARVRPDARARLSLPRLLRRCRSRRRAAGAGLRARLRGALPQRANPPRPRARDARLREELGSSPSSAFRLLPSPLGGARARARGGGSRCAGPARRAIRCRRAAAGEARSARSSAT